MNAFHEVHFPDISMRAQIYILVDIVTEEQERVTTSTIHNRAASITRRGPRPYADDKVSLLSRTQGARPTRYLRTGRIPPELIAVGGAKNGFR